MKEKFLWSALLNLVASFWLTMPDHLAIRFATASSLHRKSPADASNCWKIDWMHGRPHLIVASNNLISFSLLCNIKFLTQYPPPLLEWFMRHANQFKLLRTDENIADSIGNFPMAAPIAHPLTHPPVAQAPRISGSVLYCAGCSRLPPHLSPYNLRGASFSQRSKAVCANLERDSQNARARPSLLLNRGRLRHLWSWDALYCLLPLPGPVCVLCSENLLCRRSLSPHSSRTHLIF